jgi:hypothetical protein
MRASQMKIISPCSGSMNTAMSGSALWWTKTATQ